MLTRIIRTRRTGRRALAGLLVAVALAAVPAAGAAAATSKPVTPAKWAHTLCHGAGVWKRDLTQLAMDLNTKVPADASPARRVSALAGYMRDIAAANAKFASTLQQTYPKTKNGKKIDATIVKALEKSSKTLSSLESDLLTTDVNNPADLATVIPTAAKLQPAIDGVREGFDAADKLDRDRKVGAAIDADPGCAFLFGR